jgi:hypothetical protein
MDEVGRGSVNARAEVPPSAKKLNRIIVVTGHISSRQPFLKTAFAATSPALASDYRLSHT